MDIGGVSFVTIEPEQVIPPQKVKEWWSLTQLAGLPGLPISKRHVWVRSKKENWAKRHRQGKGGGYEYNVSALPTETQVALGVDGAIDHDSQVYADLLDMPVERAISIVQNCLQRDLPPMTPEAALLIAGTALHNIFGSILVEYYAPGLQKIVFNK